MCLKTRQLEVIRRLASHHYEEISRVPEEKQEESYRRVCDTDNIVGM